MARPRPLLGRQIVFENYTDGLFRWSCSQCEWENPYLLGTSGHPASPDDVVNNFDRHQCEEEEVPYDPDEVSQKGVSNDSKQPA